MQGDEPEVGDAGTKQRVQTGVVAAGAEPLQEGFQLLFQASAWRRLEVHSRLVKAAGYHLHGLLAAQLAYVDTAGQKSILGGEQPAMPGEEALPGEWLVVAAGGIELQFGQAFAARAGAAFGSQAQAASEGGAH
ncbi:hypothetical protein D3C81_1565960 [compost metagenome]